MCTLKLLGLCDFGAFMPWCFEFISSMTCASRQNDYGTIKHILSLSLTKMCNWTKQYRMNNNILLISCHIYLWYVVQYNYFKFLPTFNELKQKSSNSEVDNIKCYSGDEFLTLQCRIVVHLCCEIFFKPFNRSGIRRAL